MALLLVRRAAFSVTVCSSCKSVARIPIRAATCLRSQMPQSRLSTSTSSPAAADPFMLSMLTSRAKWSTNEQGKLTKQFEFRDERTANRFLDQYKDVLLRTSATLPFERAGSAVRVTISSSAGPGTSSTSAISQPELQLAMAADDVAAELQLGGRWN